MNNTYRVWCMNKNEWEKNKMALLPNGTLIDLDHHNIPVRSDTHKVYHYVGIKDKNKRAIYEGDIVKRIDFFPTADRFGREDIGVIKYINGSYFLICKDCKYLISADFDGIFFNPSYEIIGNECENFELLKEINQSKTLYEMGQEELINLLNIGNKEN